MSMIRDTFDRGEGIFRLMPNFVPRRFGQPGKRLRLHPDDLYILGTKRGAIKERWFSSVINCQNGPDTAPDEGLSYVSCSDTDPTKKFTLKEAQDELGAELVGEELMERFGGWPMYSKFFDFATPLFHHLHLDFESAARVGKLGKPEAYFFPHQLNNYAGEFPHTYFGFDPDCTIEEVKDRLKDFENRDIRITELSRAYRIELDTGWYTPPGVIHAPGSYLTYEPQWNSDVNSVYENVCFGEVYGIEQLNENCPEDKKNDVDYIASLLDWEKNIDPHYKKTYFRPPVLYKKDAAHTEEWIAYGNDYIGALRLTVNPGETVTVSDNCAYGCIVIEGNGTFGAYDCAAATVLRFGGLSQDEFFVSEQAARKGVTVYNRSICEPLVILKHFGPNHEGMPK